MNRVVNSRLMLMTVLFLGIKWIGEDQRWKNVFLSVILVNRCNILCQIQEILSEGYAYTLEEI